MIYNINLMMFIEGTSIDQEEREPYSYGSFWLHCWTIRAIRTSLHGQAEALNSNFWIQKKLQDAGGK